MACVPVSLLAVATPGHRHPGDPFGAVGAGPAVAELRLQAADHAAHHRLRLAARCGHAGAAALGAGRAGAVVVRRRGADVAAAGFPAGAGELPARPPGLPGGLHARWRAPGGPAFAIRALRRAGRADPVAAVAWRARRPAAAGAGLRAVPGLDGGAGRGAVAGGARHGTAARRCRAGPRRRAVPGLRCLVGHQQVRRAAAAGRACGSCAATGWRNGALPRGCRRALTCP